MIVTSAGIIVKAFYKSWGTPEPAGEMYGHAPEEATRYDLAGLIDRKRQACHDYPLYLTYQIC